MSLASMAIPLEVVSALELGGNYGICVGATLFVYDYLLTWQEEKQLIWDAPWSYGKSLFLFIRYSGFLLMVGFLWAQFASSTSNLSCSVIMYTLLGANIIIIHCSGLVLALRTWAIWDRTISSGVILGTAWTSVTVLASVFLVYSAMGLTPDGNAAIAEAGFTGFGGCGATESPATAAWALRLYVCLAAYEGVIFVMTVIRGVTYIYDAKPSRLMVVLYRDAFLASACLLSFNITNATLNSMESTSFYLPYLITLAFYFIIPCRIILNLRGANMVDSPTMKDTLPTRLPGRDTRGTGEHIYMKTWTTVSE